MKKKLVVCGGGNSSHILIPFLNNSVFNVYVYTSRPAQWSKTIEVEWHDANGKILDTSSGQIVEASNSAAKLFTDADYVVFCMPVHKYRIALHEIAPFLNKKKEVFLCTLYGQGGWNWMVNEIKQLYNLQNVISFAFGLIPWICRIKEYGHKGIVYGISKKANFAAVYPNRYFNQIKKELISPICDNRFVHERVEQSSNFVSLTLSADNQIIHPSRCFGLYKKYGNEWNSQEEVPLFYKDWDDTSTEILRNLDIDYTNIKNAIKNKFPNNDFSYMRDYMELERFGYESDITDIKSSFTDFGTLDSIETPIAKNDRGKWEIDRNSRFFLDDIFYGICIAKYMASHLNVKTSTIDEILHWVQMIRREVIIDNNNNLVETNAKETSFKYGIPVVYGIDSIYGCID